MSSPEITALIADLTRLGTVQNDYGVRQSPGDHLWPVSVRMLTTAREAMLDAADLIESQQAQLAAAEATIAAVREMPDRREVVPIEDNALRHMYLRGYRDARYNVHDILAAYQPATDTNGAIA